MSTTLIAHDTHLATLYTAGLLCQVCEDTPWTQQARYCDALVCATCAEGEPEPDDEHDVTDEHLHGSCTAPYTTQREDATMQYTINDTTVDITCTFRELCTMDSLHQGIYATPTPTMDATQCYIGHRPHFKDDFLLATVEDFCAAEGWTDLGWQEMRAEDREAVADETTTITVPRAKPRTEQ
jgi:hypothetical protein